MWPRRAAEAVVEIEMAEGGIEIVAPEQADHPPAEPDAFRIAGGPAEQLARPRRIRRAFLAVFAGRPACALACRRLGIGALGEVAGSPTTTSIAAPKAAAAIRKPKQRRMVALTCWAVTARSFPHLRTGFGQQYGALLSARPANGRKLSSALRLRRLKQRAARRQYAARIIPAQAVATVDGQCDRALGIRSGADKRNGSSRSAELADASCAALFALAAAAIVAVWCVARRRGRNAAVAAGAGRKAPLRVLCAVPRAARTRSVPDTRSSPGRSKRTWRSSSR